MRALPGPGGVAGTFLELDWHRSGGCGDVPLGVHGLADGPRLPSPSVGQRPDQLKSPPELLVDCPDRARAGRPLAPRITHLYPEDPAIE
ncbi:hypothetical protein GCM10023323_02760 [Streptomyces thinghirensis]|uniref:Uncharacterized protein n=1 Tax=Streptomyces thinghirensis TaxID=551547 RepID=A0ABP9SXX5_9ACTN